MIYTWEEVAKHNTQYDMWVIVNDKVYDVTDWVDKHPGGVELLRLVAGRDITVAFDSYHPFTNNAKLVINKYQIGLLKEGSYEFPPYLANTSGFYEEIKSEVGKYFRDQGLNPIKASKNPWAGMWRMTFVMIIGLLCYVAVFSNGYFNNMPILTNNPILIDLQLMFKQFCIKVSESLLLQIICTIIFGICQALPLLHIMHDSSHASFGENQTWWYISGRLFLDFYAGCNMSSWHNQHTIGHHIYTNIFKADPDLPIKESGDVRRLVTKQVWKEICKYQHIYLPFLYGLLGVSMRISDVSEVFTAHTNGPIRVNPHGFLGQLEHIVSKLFCAYWRIYIPLYIWNIPLLHYWLPLSIMAELTTGYWLAFNFQVSHISTVAEFPLSNNPVPKKDLNDKSLGVAGITNTNITGIKYEVVPLEWAVAQVIASVDYSQSSPWTTFCCGALNFQIEHHLLPSVSQYHYPAVAPIIRRVCEKYKVKYNCLSNFYEAFYYHLQYLYKLGQKGENVALQLDLH